MKHLVGLIAEAGLPAVTVEDREIVQLDYDSRSCIPGSLFFAFPGIHSQGIDYVGDAIARGAVAVVASRSVSEVETIVVKDVRKAYALMCAAFFEHPSRKLSIIGVTGTDGKSTTCDYLKQLLEVEGVRCGMLGTVYMDDGTGKRYSPYRQSTPEAWYLEQFFDRCVKNGLRTIVLECTSHALSDLSARLETVAFDMAIVTNVTSEHLEFHKTIAAYVDAKCNLVRHLKKNGTFVSTTDNRHLSEFLAALPDGRSSVILHKDVDISLEGASEAVYRGKRYHLSTTLPVLSSNALLAAVACCRFTGLSLEKTLPHLASLTPVEGRMEEIPNALGLRIIIDFAHTADAYHQLMGFLSKSKGSGRMIAVFGAAGERDASKRAPMGKEASVFCDALFLTDEDPRMERSGNIDDDIECGMARPIPVFRIDDRREAIRAVFGYAKRGDTVLFLGKGHEHSIEKKGVKIPWNEKETVRTMLEEAQRS
ncbi:MAG: UDP-N-acetylmuramyl-tripeptide synthetase [Sphaerochaetaceae bacterium]